MYSEQYGEYAYGCWGVKGYYTDINIQWFYDFRFQRQPFQAKNNPENNKWYSRDVDAMAEVTGSLPILVDADAGKC